MQLKDVFNFRTVYEEKKEVGIEVEMEGDWLPERAVGWKIHGDGSLRGNSFEYVFDGPTSRKQAVKRIETLYDQFYTEPNKIKPSENCGVHVHINHQHSEVEKIWDNITLNLILEDLLLNFCHTSRNGSLFCLKASDAEYFLTALINDKTKGVWDETLNIEKFKYANINVTTLKKYGTLEFRALETPKKADKIINWLDILLKIKDYAADYTSEEMVQQCSRFRNRFLQDIFGEHAYLFSHLNVERYLLNGVRRAQVLAFTPLGEVKKHSYVRMPDFGIIAPPPPARGARAEQPAIVDDPIPVDGMVGLPPIWPAGPDFEDE